MAYDPERGLLESAKVKRRAIKRLEGLKSERSSYDSHYQLLARNFLPRLSRFQTSDRNQKGGIQHNAILDSTGTRALRTLAAGMSSGMTSPARPWFTLRTPDADLNKSHSVREWLQLVTDLMLRVFSKSNTYNALTAIYTELGLFGTACNFISPNFDNVIHNYTATVGEYSLATNNLMQVDTIYRELEITIDQAAGWFGVDALSPQHRACYDRGDGDKTIDILHLVEPRKDRDPSKRDGKNMPFRSIYLDKGGPEDKLLQDSGFRRFPAVCPRWDVTSNDTYGNSPGMDALGDQQQLQREQFMKSKAIDYKADPPVQVPTILRGNGADILPGGVSYYDANGANSGIRTAFEVTLDIRELREDIEDIRRRIRESFFADVFLILANATDTRMTATEVAERHEEKLQMLGPVLERLQNELLQPLIDATFIRLLEAGVLPPPPEELAGIDLQVEFVSILAQAQRAISVNTTDRFVANLGSIAALKPNILDRFDEDGWVEHYSEVLGVDASLVVPMEKALFVREQRAQAQQAMQQQEAMNQMADTAQKAASAASAAGITLPAGAGYTLGPLDTQGAGDGGGTPPPLAPGSGF